MLYTCPAIPVAPRRSCRSFVSLSEQIGRAAKNEAGSRGQSPEGRSPSAQPHFALSDLTSDLDKLDVRRTLRVTTFLLVVLLLPAFAQAQSKTAPQNRKLSATGYQNIANQGNFVIQVQRNEVLVDVRVYDHKGDPVTDLKQSDFRVYEDGTLQKINAFNLENVQQLVQASERNGQAPVINLASLPKTTPASTLKRLVQNHRLMVLFFDLSSLQIDDLIRSLKAAQNFVQEQLTPADLVAIVTYSSDLRVVQDFTNDRKVLAKAIKSIEVGPSSTLASNGGEGAAGGSDSFGNAIVTQNTGDAFTPDETEFNIFNTDEKLAALESLADLLRAVPGRKSVIQFSSGITQTGVDNEAQLQETIDAANMADVSFYPMDSRGLVAMPPGGDASSASPSGTGIYTAAAVSSEISSLHSSRDTLSNIARDTGGRMFADLNNFAPAFQDVQKENSSYYLLGYSPSDTSSDGRFRHIKVVVDRKGIRLQARPGYFAPKNFRQFTREDKEEQLQQAMNSPQPFLELPLAVESAHFRQSRNLYYVVVAAKIPGSEVPFRAKSAVHETEFDFAWRATNSKGQVMAALDDTLPVKLDANTFKQVLKSNILYEGGLLLPPGNYTLKVVVREDQTGKIGTFAEPLILPEPKQHGLALSSVVVSNQLGGAGAEASSAQRRQSSVEAAKELKIGSRTVLPSVTRVFRTSQDLYVYLKSYGNSAVGGSKKVASQHSKESTPPSFALIFFRNGIEVSEAGPYPGKATKNGSQNAIYFTRIPLQKFPPGSYVMQVNVLDPAADQVAFSRLPIAIMPPPPSSTAPPSRKGA
jgi:VWFA-related protein